MSKDSRYAYEAFSYRLKPTVCRPEPIALGLNPETRVATPIGTTTALSSFVIKNQWLPCLGLALVGCGAGYIGGSAPDSGAGDGPTIDAGATSDGGPVCPQAQSPSLRVKYASLFSIGVAVEPDELVSAQSILLGQFNRMTAENAMKFGPIHPAEATYDFVAADSIANFARKNCMTMTGHTSGARAADRAAPRRLRGVSRLDAPASARRRRPHASPACSWLGGQAPRVLAVAGTWCRLQPTICRLRPRLVCEVSRGSA